VTRDRILFALRLAVSAGLVALLVVQLVRQGVDAWPPAIGSWDWIAIALALLPASILVRTVNFMILVNARGRVMHLGQATYLTLVGAATAIFLPAGAGDLVKAHIGYRAYGEAEKVVASSIIDKLTSLVTVAVLGVIGGIAAGEQTLAIVSAVIALISGVMIAFPVIIPYRLVMKITTPGVEVQREKLADATRPPALLLTQVLALSFAGWLFTFGVLYAVCMALSIDVSLGYVYSMAPFMTLTSLIPIALSGIGLVQVTLVYLLTRAGVPDALALQAAFIHLVIMMLPALVGALLFAIRGTREQSR
jgi:uncharacterized membrane protein YbhN (UPF0104 family)